MKKLFLFLLVPVFALAQSPDQNYTQTTTYRGAGGTLPQTTITYFDGLGRPIQKINNAQSNSGKNIVTHIEYDIYGRQVKEYLPYKSESSTLDYISNSKSELESYYNTPSSSINGNPASEATLFPYSEKLLEASPLDKILKQTAPGNTWAMNSGHEIKFDYQTNVESGVNAVKLFKALTNWNSNMQLFTTSIVQENVHPANTLYLTVTKDENWTSGNNHTTQEFKDESGRILLKRAFNNNEAHETYYVYDLFGNLTYVIPPLAEGIIDSNTLNGLCYQYQYDSRNRLAAKKLPGKQWEFIVYDKLDRPLITGPALSPWGTGENGVMVMEYDVFGRVTQTGWIEGSIDATIRGNYQNSVNLGNNPFTLSTNDILTKNFYDNYNYPDAPVVPNDIEGQNVETAIKGLGTGSWVRILTIPTEVLGETTHTFYDVKYRSIRNHVDNYLGGYTETDNHLDFMGKIQYTITRHKRTDNDNEIVITDTFTYTVQDKLATHTHQIDQGDIQLLASNTYDELGELVSKSTGGSPTSITPLQKVDYQYNIRGWLKSINDVNGLVSSDLSSPNDLFAFKISYDQSTDPTKALYNGNISETYWKTFNDDQLRKYDYTYDHLNRLLQADYSRPDNINIKNAYKESLTYDKNGNIQSLVRNGVYESEDYEYEIDNLTYTYDLNNKNQLAKVTDSSGFYQGFSEVKDGDNDGTNDYTDYSYDDNGNIIGDQNKGITEISYNHLNLPVKIIFDNNSNTRIEYIYDATGKKVEKKVYYNKRIPISCGGGGGGENSRNSVSASIVQQCYSSVPSVDKTNYLQGGFQYKQNVLEFFPHSEGFVKNYSGTYQYKFNYTDHLGNVRLSYFDQGDGTAVIDEESNYYPFGQKHQGYNEPAQYQNFWGNTVTSSSELGYKYKLNGKELQDELGLNMYAMDARLYDPAIGRWVVLDPVTHHNLSPYNAFDNNPVFWADPSGADSVGGNEGGVIYRGSHWSDEIRGVKREEKKPTPVNRTSTDSNNSSTNSGGSQGSTSSGSPIQDDWRNLTKQDLINYVRIFFCSNCSQGSLQNMAGKKFEEMFEDYIDREFNVDNFRVLKNELKIQGDIDYTVPDYFGVRYNLELGKNSKISALHSFYEIERMYAAKATKNNIGKGSFGGQLKIQIQVAKKMGIKELTFITTYGVKLTKPLFGYAQQRDVTLTHYWAQYQYTNKGMILNFVPAKY